MAARRLDLQQYFQDCTPSYFNGDGKYGPVWDYFYGDGPVEYRIVLENWRKDNLDKDLSLERRRAHTPRDHGVRPPHFTNMG
jgi:hypothetical protein